MRIVVCVKHVPDLDSVRGFDAEGRTVRSTADGTLNEVDENAVEAALTLRDGGGEDAEVIALTVGPPSAVDAVRRALQMGADRGIHISDDALVGADYAATAAVLAAAVRHAGGVDAVVTGMAALDGLGAVVPSLLAAELGLPQLTVAHEVSCSGPPDHVVTIQRDVAGATETWRAPLPVVLSVTDVANSPRLPKMKEMLAARSKEVATLTLDDLGVAAADVAPRTEVLSATERPPHPGPELVTDDDGEGGRKLAEYLISGGLI
ncbi:electron transfer flavoprotein subunit beta/FixA family protein [Ruania alba]|uniref:Electron transfer flavoprotein subunit beta n=1 Tax=Ruania alba TaxID=648782 RepID=A0A1H5NG57_9MICO|nr:electron transfer flavoprotein subunit beta/FixA family protein [Ruania alba]SEF00440.1 electron transfer flavoprotein beta subunit [Ruania alba]